MHSRLLLGERSNEQPEARSSAPETIAPQVAVKVCPVFHLGEAATRCGPSTGGRVLPQLCTEETRTFLPIT